MPCCDLFLHVIKSWGVEKLCKVHDIYSLGWPIWVCRATGELARPAAGQQGKVRFCETCFASL